MRRDLHFGAGPLTPLQKVHRLTILNVLEEMIKYVVSGEDQGISRFYKNLSKL